MTDNDQIIKRFSNAIADISNIEIDYSILVNDIVLMEMAFPDHNALETALTNTKRAIEDVANDKVDSSFLDYEYKDWNSYHYQSVRVNGQKSDLRVIYKKHEGKVRIIGFGHRRNPTDIYKRLGGRIPK